MAEVRLVITKQILDLEIIALKSTTVSPHQVGSKDKHKMK